jgi:hypothetical protein
MIGLNEICFVCRKTITQEDVEKNNRPMKMMSIPGFVHRKCKIGCENIIMASKFNEVDLTNEIKKL